MIYARMSDSYSLSIEIMNYIFTGLYNIECIMKIIGLGCQYFTHDSWNLFDFICVVGSDIAIVLILCGVGGPAQSIVIFLRAFRLVRLLRFISSFWGLSTMKTLIYSAPQIQNILSLLSIIVFMYAVLGINMFSSVMYKEDYNEQNNFRNIFNALVLLLRCMTGESWNGIMHDLAKSNDEDQKCISNQTYDDMQRDGIRGCGTWLAFPYFISFFIINAVIILDLSIGVFINALSDGKKMEKSVLSRSKMENFLELWAEYDPDSTGWITADQLLFLIYELPPPLGLGKINPDYESVLSFDKYYNKLVRENLCEVNSAYQDNKIKQNIILKKNIDNEYYLINKQKGLVIRQTRTPQIVSKYNIPLYEGNFVHFKDVVNQLIRNAFDSFEEEYLPNKYIQGKIDRRWKNKWKK